MKEQCIDIHGKPYNRTLMIALILVATFAGVLNQTSLGTALPTLMKDFDISVSTAQQATTWFLLANGIMIPVSAYLSTRFSTRTLYVSAYCILFLGLLMATLTPTSHWTIFLFARIVQAIAVGITLPLLQVVMVNVYPIEKRGAAMGINGLIVGLAPAIGPTLSGWILKENVTIMGYNLSWRFIFIIPLVIIGICLIITPFLVKDVVQNKPIKLDIPSLILSIIGFGLFLWGFTNVATKGWLDFPYVVVPIVIGLIVIIIFALRQLKMTTPFLDVRVFKVKQFTLTSLVISLSMMAMMGVEMMLPLYLQNVHALSAMQSGLVLFPGALVYGFVSPIAGSFYDKVGAKRLALLGFAILFIGTVPFVFLTATVPNLFITLLYAVRMFAIALIMMPLTASAMSALPAEKINYGTAANNTVRQIASAVVVALLSSVTQNVITANQPTAELQKANPIAYFDQLIHANLDGFHRSFMLALCFAVLGFTISCFLEKKRQHTGTKEKI